MQSWRVGAGKQAVIYTGLHGIVASDKLRSDHVLDVRPRCDPGGPATLGNRGGPGSHAGRNAGAPRHAGPARGPEPAGVRRLLHGQRREAERPEPHEERHRRRAAIAARPRRQRQAGPREASGGCRCRPGPVAGSGHAVLEGQVSGLVAHRAGSMDPSRGRGGDDEVGERLRRRPRRDGRGAGDAAPGIREPQGGTKRLGRHLGAV